MSRKISKTEKQQGSELESRLKRAYEMDSVADIAERLGVSYPTLNHYLRGRLRIKTDLVLKVYEQTGVSIHWLLTGNGPERAEEEAHALVAESRSNYGGVDLEELRREAIEKYLLGELQATINRRPEDAELKKRR